MKVVEEVFAADQDELTVTERIERSYALALGEARRLIDDVRENTHAIQDATAGTPAANRALAEVMEGIHNTFDVVELLSETEEMDSRRVQGAVSDLNEQIASFVEAKGALCEVEQRHTVAEVDAQIKALKSAKKQLLNALDLIEEYQGAAMVEAAYEGEGESFW